MRNPVKVRPAGSRQSGQTTVEFALAATVLFLVVFGLVELGIAVYSYQQISTAAREAARYAIVHAPISVDPNDIYPATNAQIQQFAINRAIGVPLTTSNVTVNWVADPNNSCTPTCLWDVQVQVSYAVPLHIPFFSQKSLPITSTSQMLVSY
jgi:Flp pilus assembly protein TadG